MAMLVPASPVSQHLQDSSSIANCNCAEPASSASASSTQKCGFAHVQGTPSWSNRRSTIAQGEADCRRPANLTQLQMQGERPDGCLVSSGIPFAGKPAPNTTASSSIKPFPVESSARGWSRPWKTTATPHETHTISQNLGHVHAIPSGIQNNTTVGIRPRAWIEPNNPIIPRADCQAATRFTFPGAAPGLPQAVPPAERGWCFRMRCTSAQAGQDRQDRQQAASRCVFGKSTEQANGILPAHNSLLKGKQ
ncbi:hypothetical protein B0H67DRAFT_145892 [Lasiosphaeris hirsuta]|uniref:Uncharacterized protein n=1 Tax=Lasiosphaeris hirsuta TaxID=260670 RepID=A0AA40B1N5_9PEZI|nr:hypothetical protein B0H67DRAFT_145892 [Lasiosphaeris hirsuta]